MKKTAIASLIGIGGLMFSDTDSLYKPYRIVILFKSLNMEI